VHGYKKLSHVNRKEISRTNIILPAMEFDTEAIWIDADASNLRDLVMDFDSGVHALSHAMVAVASVFTPCTSEDIDCDHSRFECTRVLMYDTRAGGSGATSSLYDKLTDLLQCAVELLDDCTSCHSEAKYDGGCPGCLHSVPCDNFQQDLSRRAGITIGKYLLERLKRTASRAVHKKSGTSSTGKLKAVLIGRPSWLENREHSQFAEIDE
jgi:DEAD/DEAH box helicase domain-containing protein